MSGPLNGIRIIELAGIGPGPFAAMVLADAGANIIRIDRPTNPNAKNDPALAGRAMNIMNRGRRSITVDLKSTDSADFILRMVEHADGLIEGFRPGVTERLGIGPDECIARNPRLVYGRVTGWGRRGSYAQAAGHDINYIALSGTLGALGPASGPPQPPMNLLGDFGGGGLLLAYGMTCALLEVNRTGQGQAVDVAMVDGAAYLATYIHGLRSLGLWNDGRASNILDGGAPFYQVYETSDGRYISVGAIEYEFFSELLELIGLSNMDVPTRDDRAGWDRVHEIFTSVFSSRTRDEWENVFAGTDACVTPVLSMAEAPENEHLKEWGTFENFQGVVQPSPAPRFSRTPSSIQRPAPRPGQDGDLALREWGFEDGEIAELMSNNVIAVEQRSADSH